MGMYKAARTCFFFLPEYLVFSLGFEFLSKLGRLTTGDFKVDRSKKCYINLGSGTVIVQGFVNIDFFYSKGIDYGADLRFPLRIPDNSIDGIFCEHTFEHLTYADDLKLFKECYRILKPGAVLRIVLPDVSLFIKNYAEHNEAWFRLWERLMLTESTSPERAQRRLSTYMEAVSFVTQEYGHRSAWDFDTLKVYLQMAGFSDINKVSFRQGQDPHLLIDFDAEDRKLVSIYLEVRK